MKHYGGRLIENVELKVNPIYPETTHSIRVLSFISGLILIAMITKSEGGFVHCVFPMEVMISLDEDEGINVYEFIPYLENLAEFDINKAYVYVFPVHALQSVTVPSNHLTRNYTGQLMMLKKIKDEQDGVPEPEIMH